MSSAYAARVIADGAAHYWRLDETYGTQARDLIGNAHGAISGGVVLGAAGATPDGNMAAAFDGATGTIVTAAPVTIPIAATLEAWINYVLDGTYQPILAVGYSQAPSWFIYPTGELGFYDGSLNGTHNGTFVTAGAWHHVACVLTATTATLYRDGIQDTAGGYARTAGSSGVVSIGNDPAFGLVPNGFCNGTLDEIAIYPRALSAAEIAAHYDLATGGSMTPELAVLTRLLAIPEVIAIIGDRGYVFTLPQGAKAPYVRVQAVSEVSRGINLRGGGGPRESHIQIDCFARELSGTDAYAEVAALAAAIDGIGDGTGLDGWRGAVGDVWIDAALRIDRNTRYEADEQRLMRFQLDYRVHWRRAKTVAA